MEAGNSWLTGIGKGTFRRFDKYCRFTRMDFVLPGHVISLLRSCLVALAAGHAAPKEFNVELYIYSKE